MLSSVPRNIVIIGGGFAGAVTALRLIETVRGPLNLVVIEPSKQLGRGIAYATPEPDHVVNGIAGAFTLRPTEPDHFVQWLARRADAGSWVRLEDADLAHSSPPRGLYGAYVGEELDRAVREAGARLNFTHLRARAVGVGEGAVLTAEGRAISAEAVILATGLHRRRLPVDPALAASGRYVDDIFAPDAFAAARQASRVLLLGSGLAMLDTLISLEKQGFRGSYTVVSRRGLLVEPRREVQPWPAEPGTLPRTAAEVLRWVQRHRRASRVAGADWQGLSALYRDVVPAVWSGLADNERARLLARLLPFWNLSQHRAAPSSFAVLERLRAEGRLVHLAGTVTELHVAASRVAATLRRRGEQVARSIHADMVVSALGYEFDWNRIDDPLVRNLVASGSVTPHPVGLGLRADPRTLALVDADGRKSHHLFAVGHPLRGEIWESNSIREQLVQASRLAAHIAERTIASEDRQVA